MIGSKTFPQGFSQGSFFGNHPINYLNHYPGYQQGFLNAFATKLASLPDPSWYINSGASTHVTYDLSSMSQASKYSGYDWLIVGLHISYIGNVQLVSSSKPSMLHNVLYAPNIKKNLLSIVCLVYDKNVVIEFMNDFYFVKDKVVGHSKESLRMVYTKSL